MRKEHIGRLSNFYLYKFCVCVCVCVKDTILLRSNEIKIFFCMYFNVGNFLFFYFSGL